MRVFLIALVIALLPVRGWVGDAMAVSMAASGLATASAAEAPCPHAGIGHHAEDTGDAALAAGAHGASQHGHLLCDVCNGPALTPAALVAPPSDLNHGLLIERAERFASLAPRHTHKPPIA